MLGLLIIIFLWAVMKWVGGLWLSPADRVAPLIQSNQKILLSASGLIHPLRSGQKESPAGILCIGLSHLGGGNKNDEGMMSVLC